MNGLSISGDFPRGGAARPAPGTSLSQPLAWSRWRAAAPEPCLGRYPGVDANSEALSSRPSPSGKPAGPEQGWRGRKGVWDQAVQSLSSDLVWSGRSGRPGQVAWAPRLRALAREVPGCGASRGGWRVRPCGESLPLAEAGGCACALRLEAVCRPVQGLQAGLAGGVHQPARGGVRGGVCVQCGRPVLEAVCTGNEEDSLNYRWALSKR